MISFNENQTNDKLPQFQKTHCGESRIRTCEVERQQIYSLPQLAALVSPLTKPSQCVDL